MLPNPNTFEITKRSPRPYRSLVLPTGANAGRGQAYMEEPANPGNAIPATGTVPIAGFVTRNVLIGGPTLADAIYPNRIELPFQDGTAGSFEQAEEVEAEGYGATFNGDTQATGAYLYSGTGGTAGNTISNATATGTRASFLNGQFCVATTGMYSEYYITAILPPNNPANTFRVRFGLIAGQKV